MKNKPYVITILVAIAIAALGFFAGVKYQEITASSGKTWQYQGRAANAGGQGRGGQRGGGMTIGEIIGQDDKSVTIKLDDGSSKIIFLSDNAVIAKTDTAAKGDLKTGVRVGVFGTTNSDGSITAQNVQLNPQFRGSGASSSPSPK